MRATKPLILCAILVFSCLPISNVSAESQEICCDSGPIDLYFIGSESAGTMTPFDVELSDESEEKRISDAIAQSQEIVSWEINPSWPGSFQSSTWDFSLSYEVEKCIKIATSGRPGPVWIDVPRSPQRDSIKTC